MGDGLSAKALQLILDHEVGGGQVYYDRFLSQPNWPGGESGVTIGIGYDLGYTPATRFLEDWADLPIGHRHALLDVTGARSYRAKNKMKELVGVRVPWELALRVFKQRTVPYWMSQTRKAFRNTDELPADAFGALVSLVFNRGPSLSGRNREEMQEIEGILADGVQCGDLQLIARQLREMKRIWSGRGLDGLLRRREDEAKLVEGAGC